MTVASTGEGIVELADALAEHRTYLEDTGLLERRRRAAALEHARQVLERTVSRRAATEWARAQADTDGGEPLGGGLSPYEVARRIAARVCRPPNTGDAD
jgi:LAO/AO transport system kinase